MREIFRVSCCSVVPVAARAAISSAKHTVQFDVSFSHFSLCLLNYVHQGLLQRERGERYFERPVALCCSWPPEQPFRVPSTRSSLAFRSRTFRCARLCPSGHARVVISSSLGWFWLCSLACASRVRLPSLRNWYIIATHNMYVTHIHFDSSLLKGSGKIRQHRSHRRGLGLCYHGGEFLKR